MGRGRQKAKQTKVARQLKYFSPNTDYTALQRELSGSTDHETDEEYDTGEEENPDPGDDSDEEDDFDEEDDSDDGGRYAGWSSGSPR